MDRPLALYRRYLWESKNISWIYTSSVRQLLASRDYYLAAAGMEPAKMDAAAQRELDDLIIAATLAAESQVERDMWGWTIRIPLKPWGLFCGIEPEGTVCARFTELRPELAADPVGCFAIQRVTANLPVRQTSLIPCDESVRYLVEQYFEESEQLPARLAIRDDEAVMALSMPDASWDAVKSLKADELFDLFHTICRTEQAETPAEDTSELSEKARALKAKFAAAKGSAIGSMHGELKLMHEAVFYYGCRCDAQNIAQMIAALPAEQQKELWQDSPTLDVQCPRCGRTHIIARNA